MIIFSRIALAVLLLAGTVQTVLAGSYERIDKERHAIAGGRWQNSGSPPPARPYTQDEAWLLRLLEATRNGEVFKRPEAFVEWLDEVTEPRFMTALATVAVDPVAYPRLLARAIEPTNTLNSAEFNDPALYLRWLAAGTNPAFFKAIFDRMANPGKFMRWSQAPQSLLPVLSRYNPAATAQGAALALRPAAPPTRIATPQDAASKASRPREEWARLPSEGPGSLQAAARHYRY